MVGDTITKKAGKAEPLNFSLQQSNIKIMDILETKLNDTMKIVTEIRLCDHPNKMRENLREMFDAFFLYYESLDNDFKYDIYTTYKALDTALKSIIELDSFKKSQEPVTSLR